MTKKDIQKLYTDHILSFLESHSLISVNLLEQELALPQSTIGKAKSGDRLIPEKHIFDMLCFLSDYGIKDIHGHTLVHDKPTNTLFGYKRTAETKTFEIQKYKNGKTIEIDITDGQNHEPEPGLISTHFKYYNLEYRTLYSSFSDLI